MNHPQRRSDAHTPLIAWGQAFTLIVLIYSGAESETAEQVQAKALNVIYELGADDDYKDMLRSSLKLEPQDQFFSALQEQ